MTTPFHPIFLALSEPVRLRIFLDLCGQTEALTPALIASRLSVRPATVSHHLVKLEAAELVCSLPSGRNVLYAINRTTLNLFADFIDNLKLGLKP